VTSPVIITVAITGALPRKKDNPAVPVTPAEQIESTHEAFEAGASIVHIHVRNPRALRKQPSHSDPAIATPDRALSALVANRRLTLAAPRTAAPRSKYAAHSGLAATLPATRLPRSGARSLDSAT